MIKEKEITLKSNDLNKSEKGNENSSTTIDNTENILEENKKIEISNINTQSEIKNEPTTFTQIQNESISKSYSWIKAILIFITIFLCMLIAIFTTFSIYNFKHNLTITQGVYIYGINVSNLTKSEAKEKVSTCFSETLSNDITLMHNDYTTYINTSEINLNFDIDSAVNYAFSLGKTQNIFQDNYQIFNAMLNGVDIMPKAQFDKDALNNILNKLSAELPDAVVESGYYIDNNNLIITKGTNGYIINVDETSKEIEQKLLDLSYLKQTIEITTQAASPKEIDIDSIYNEIHKDAQNAYYTTDPFVVYPSSTGIDFKIPIDEAKQLLETSDSELTIPLKTLYPSITTNMIGQEAFPDLLGTFSTKYAASNGNRTTNLKLAANKINGTVLLTDEVFSYNTVVGQRTIAAGYREAAVYQNGEVVQGLGGGICQISTTLYNAVLYANLKIVELHNHQFVPSYVTAGRDATVVYGVKDFQFKNNRKYPIKITCSVSGGIATFNIWGHREENEYDISVYANVNSKTASYIKSSTYRTLKQNGQIIKTENIINSTYKAH